MKKKTETQLVHGRSQDQNWEFKHHLIPPITANTTFRLESLKRGAQGFTDFVANAKSVDPIWVYDRLDEPNTSMLESQISDLENYDAALCFNTGMAAISSTFMCLLKNQDMMLAHHTLYGCTHSLIASGLPRLGIETAFIDFKTKEWMKHLTNKKFKLIYFESLSNPNLELLDFEFIVSEVQKENLNRKPEDEIKIVVDSTFTTPLGFQPKKWGVDVVIHSLTKCISGFGTEMGGIVCGDDEFIKKLKLVRKDFGTNMNPHSAWHIYVHGLPTLKLRYEKQQENALKVAQFLTKASHIKSVTYPGLEDYSQTELARKYLISPDGDFSPGYMLAFQLNGDIHVLEKFVNFIASDSYSITLAVSLGLTKTLIEVPGYMTHSGLDSDQSKQADITGLEIRMSVGIENIKDILSDLETALDRL